MIRVLVVDDDRSLIRALTVGLNARGHEVIYATSGEDGVTSASLDSPDIVILDLGLPDINGLEICRRLRQWSDVPIIVLSASGLEDMKVKALDEGADDYITKPFGMRELEARIRTALRHRKQANTSDNGTIEVGGLVLDVPFHQVTFSGNPIELTSKEFELLAYLARYAGKVCTHQMILESVWGGRFGGEAESLRVHVHRLRRKLGDSDGCIIRTSPGIGYSLMPVEIQH